MKPDWRFLLAHPAHFLALGFGSGLSPVAPGTAGTLLAWLLFALGSPWIAPVAFWPLLAGLYLLGILACQRTGRALGVADHGAIVIDEIVPFWIVLALIPETFFWQAAAFVGFRFYDITKPQPARWVDRRLKNGFGVMLDDLVAAGYTLLSLALLQVVLNG